jgi:TolA-binding protein
MRNLTTVLLILTMTSVAWGETRITELPDRIVVEVSSGPLPAAELESRAKSQRARDLEASLRVLEAEYEEMKKRQPGESREVIQLRQTRRMEKLREIEQLRDELREVNHQIPANEREARPEVEIDAAGQQAMIQTVADAAPEQN